MRPPRQRTQKVACLQGIRVHRSLVAGMCVFWALYLSACQDTELNPLALAVAPETHGAVLFLEQLSSVPHLLDEKGLAGEGFAEAEAWRESWRLGGEEGARLRSLVYPAAVRRLYPVMGEVGVMEILTRQSERMEVVESLRPALASRAMGLAFQRAASLHEEAWVALGKGEGEKALSLALRTVDALWEVTPHQVAVDLVERADEALGRNRAPVPYSDQELTRIRRLLNGAKEALAREDYPLAIRRAYYACQLLGADPS